MKRTCVIPMHNGVPSMLQLTRIRIGQLTEPARRMMVIAALYGEEFPLLAIQSAVAAEEAPPDALDDAMAAQLIVAERPGWYRFRHPLTHAAVLELARPAERRHAATQLAEALLAEQPEPSGPTCRLVARLFADAGQSARAGQWYARSGRLALRTRAVEWAATDLTEALRLSDPGMPAPNLLSDLIHALWQAGQLDPALELVDRLDPALAGPDLRSRARVYLELAWACCEYGRIEEARLQLAKAGSLVVGTDVELLRIHCRVIAARLASDPPGATTPVGEREARAAAKAAERVVDRATEAAERQAAAEVACRAWDVLARMLRQDRYQVSIRIRRRILALADRHELPDWALYERRAIALERCWVDGDELPIRVLLNETQRLGHLNVAVHLQSSLCAHEVLVRPGSLASAVAGLTTCADRAGQLGDERVHSYAVGMVLMAAVLREDHQAVAETLARYQIARSGRLSEYVDAAQAFCLALAGRDDEALSTLQDVAQHRTIGRAVNVSFGLLLLLGTLAGSITAEQVSEALAGSSPARWTRQFLHWAAAVHAGQRGDRAEAERQAALAAHAAEIYPATRHLAARLVAPAADADGWGNPVDEVRAAEAWFHAQGMSAAARSCRDVLRSLGVPVQQRRNGVAGVPAELRAAGVTVREYEVGLLVGEHLGNRDIGRRLHISPRTVEKHTSALLAKLDLPDRRTLIARLADG